MILTSGHPFLTTDPPIPSTPTLRRARLRISRSLIVGPHSQYANDPFLGEYLIHHAVLNVYSPRVSASQVSNQLLKGWRILVWIGRENRKQFLGFWLEPAGGKLLGIFERLFGKNDLPTHHLSAFALFANGSAIPALMDSHIPGTASRYKVSCIALQSSADSKTALVRFPEMRMGSCDCAVSSMIRYKFARASLAVSACISIPLVFRPNGT